MEITKDDFEVTNVTETKLDNGDYLISFEVPLWVDDLLKEKFGKEDYSQELSKHFSYWVMNDMKKDVEEYKNENSIG